MKYFLFTSEEYHKICLNINDYLNREYNTNLDEILNSSKFVLMTEKDIIKSFASKIYDKKLGKSSKPNYLFRCSYDNCNGFVNDNFECELCHCKYCNKCSKLIEYLK